MREIKTSMGSIGKIIHESVERTQTLESKFKQLEKNMNSSKKEWQEQMNKFRIDLAILESEIDNVKINFKKKIKLFFGIVQKLKDTGNKEDFKKLNKKIDEWNPENLVNREEFESMVKEYILEELEIETEF